MFNHHALSFFLLTEAGGASGSFCTNSPASPLSSVSLTSPLSPFSPVPGSQISPTKQLGSEVSTRNTRPEAHPNPKFKPSINPCSDYTTIPEVRRRSSPKPRSKSCTNLISTLTPNIGLGPKSLESQSQIYIQIMVITTVLNLKPITLPQPSSTLQYTLREPSCRLDPVTEETERNVNCITGSNLDQHKNVEKPTDREQTREVQCQVSLPANRSSNQHSDTQGNHYNLQVLTWLTSKSSNQQVLSGHRKDVHPDSNQSHHDGLRNLSVTESPILLFQDSIQGSLFSPSSYSLDLSTASHPCVRGACSESQRCRNFVSRTSFHTARPLTYPNKQLQLGSNTDSELCAVPQSDMANKLSLKMFMQAHL